MNYTHYLHKLSSGHTIVTPHGKEITEEEFREYFEIISKWLKDVRPKTYESIKPNPDNNDYCSMLCKMFDAYLYDFEEGGTQEKYFLDKRTLTFLFVVSYYIQKENRENLSPELSHIMGNALLLWLPIKELVEHYLAASSDNLYDNFLLVRLFCPNLGFINYGFTADTDKALKYATALYNNPLNQHRVDNYDYAYVRALLEKDINNASTCINILNKKLNKYSIEWEDFTDTLLNYLILELEISSKVGNIQINLDLNYVEGILSKQPECSSNRNQGYYWLAQCYINGKNNQKDLDKAIELLGNIKDHRLIKKVGVSLAKIYLEEDNVIEAYHIASIAELQSSVYPSANEDGEQLSSIKEKALSLVKQENYKTLLCKVLNKEISSVDIKAIDLVLRISLEEEEYQLSINNDFVAISQTDLLHRIIVKLKHPATREKIQSHVIIK